MRIVVTYRHHGDDQYLSLIEKALASAKRFDYETVLVGNIEAGDLKLPVKEEADGHLMNWILAAQLAYIESPLFSCNTVIFSPDALILRPLASVFLNDFDVAVTTRSNRRWPINNGVIFLKHTRKHAIAQCWRRALEICRAYPEDIQKWYGDQQALHEMIVSGYPEDRSVKVMELPCAQYNASPDNDGPIDEIMMQTAYIIHLKGKRKPKMADYWKRLTKGKL
jgi:hypothetical protein